MIWMNPKSSDVPLFSGMLALDDPNKSNQL